MLSRPLFLLGLAIVLTLSDVGTGRVLAGWREDSGYSQLSTELGASLPTGSGIVVLQSEADVGSFSYLPVAMTSSPFTGSGSYDSKVFYADSGIGGYSDHANSVGWNFYGISGSLAPGIPTVHCREANDFINQLALSGGPAALAGTVANHSWIGTTGDAPTDTRYLRAFDYQINRDNILACVPLNNNTGPVPELMACNYHAMTVGLRNGVHSRGGTVVDGTGRMKPDLVVNESLTSLASPAVASAAALLREKILASFSVADHPQAIKAILLAGASKSNLPAWQRASTSAPYDSVFGAGELNVLNAYHVLAEGQQAASTTAEVSCRGWDYRSVSTSSSKRYFFTVPDGSCANTFSAALTWHRKLALVAGNYTSTLPQLTLKLYAASGLTIVGTALDQSISTVDNVQHLFLRNLPSGQYALEVSSNTNNINYGLAWEAQTGTGPALSVRIDGSGNVFLDMAQLDPFVTYTIQQSSTLTSWSDATTVRTADTAASTTATWPDTSATAGTSKFYRLQWTAVR